MRSSALALKAGKGKAVKRVTALVAITLSVPVVPVWARAGGWHGLGDGAWLDLEYGYLSFHDAILRLGNH